MFYVSEFEIIDKYLIRSQCCTFQAQESTRGILTQAIHKEKENSASTWQVVIAKNMQSYNTGLLLTDVPSRITENERTYLARQETVNHSI